MPDFQTPAFNLAARLTSRTTPLPEGMRTLLAYCRKRAPRSRIWPKVSKLDYENALRHFAHFIARELHRAPPNIRNFYVGIREVGDDTIGLALYLLGTHRPRTTPRRGSKSRKSASLEPWVKGPWWNEDGPAWTHPTLSAIATACENEPDFETSISARYALANGFVGLSLAQLVDHLPPETWTRAHLTTAIAAGFPGGDTMLVGVVKRPVPRTGSTVQSGNSKCHVLPLLRKPCPQPLRDG